MKRIGIVGGMSWESTANYYKWINEGIRAIQGGLSSALLSISSLDFAPIEKMQRAGKWQEIGNILTEEMKKLEEQGADFIILTSNTMHKMSDLFESALSIPFLHICDTAANRILSAQLNHVGLLGTSYTMEQDFYRSRLESKGLTVSIPNKTDRGEINRIIFEELCQGKILESSHDRFSEIIRSLSEQGSQGIILGCTEISMTVKDKDSPVPLFDTAKIHCEEAVKMALE